jgi:hypothetical protein
MLGPRRVHLEDLLANYGSPVLIERGLRGDEGLEVLTARYKMADMPLQGRPGI